MSDRLELDERGKLCPQPIIDLSAAMKSLDVGDELKIVCDDAAFPLDLEAWCLGQGHELCFLESDAGVHSGRVRKLHE